MTDIQGAKNSFLKDANCAFRDRNYELALQLYTQAAAEAPNMASSIEFNISLCQRRIHPNKIPQPFFQSARNALPTPLHTEAISEIDREYYLSENPDVENAGFDPEKHYYSFGEKEGRKPNRYFDPNFYYRINADVRTAGISALYHYKNFGRQEGRLPYQEKQQSLVEKSTKQQPLLFVGHDGMQGGAQVVLLEIVKWFSQHTNRRIKVLLLGPGLMTGEYSKYSETFVLPHNNVDTPSELCAFLNENFSFAYLSTVVSGRFIKIMKKYDIYLNTNIIANIHEMDKVLEIFEDELNELIPAVDLWISGSPESTKALHEKYHIAQDKIETVTAFIKPIAHELSNDNLHKASARTNLELSPSDFVIMGCGTVYWRKGPDIFIETARKIKTLTNRDIKFIWIGDGPDKDGIVANLSIQESNYIKFLGHKENANELLAAADLFFLSSREDPFPLVVLHAAQHAVPSICFSEATGITEFISNDAGLCLDKISSDIAAKEIINLINSQTKLSDLGSKAKHRLFDSYTTEKKLPQIFCAIKRKTNYKPTVSVIVPFYNHEKFLHERLDSILNQTLKDIEVIALDDCSTDRSCEVVKSYSDPRLNLYINEKNSGSPFYQWKKGIELAKSDIVWIAEGDDSCDLDFLAKLIRHFDDPLVNIAYSRMEMMDEFSTIKIDAFKPYFDNINPKKFNSSYINIGHKEIEDSLAFQCTLINASGLLIRKSSFGKNIEIATQYKMCGDWLIYLECLLNGKVAYCYEAVNYFRRHSTSQVNKIEGTDSYFTERYNIAKYVSKNFELKKSTLKQMFDAIDNEWERFKHKNVARKLNEFFDKKEIYSAAIEKSCLKTPSILVVASDFSPGGGQLFAIRLANALKENGNSVVMINVAKFPTHPQIVEKIDAGVIYYNASEINFSEVINNHKINIVHSSLWWADKYVYENLHKLDQKIGWVVSMHGCYETLLKSPEADPCFLRYFENMCLLVDQWVYTADKNKAIFEKNDYPLRLKKVLNGFKPEQAKPLSKRDIGLKDNTFIICLASRAIESKGWNTAVNAVNMINADGGNVELLLIGEGNVADDIAKNYISDCIHLIGQVSNLADYIAISDLGILPTTFIGESMPLVLLEFMAQGKPIISTNIGEIENMTLDKDGAAAIILDVRSTISLDDQLKESILKIISDPALSRDMAVNSKRLFSKFTMDNMLNNYIEIYTGIMQ